MEIRAKVLFFVVKESLIKIKEIQTNLNKKKLNFKKYSNCFYPRCLSVKTLP